jgi:hypothetical protein
LLLTDKAGCCHHYSGLPVPPAECPNPYGDGSPGYVLIDNLCPDDELLVATVRRVTYEDDPRPDTVYGWIKSDGWMDIAAGATNISDWGSSSRDQFILYVSVIRKTDWQPVMPYIYATDTSIANNNNNSSTNSSSAGSGGLKFVDISSTKKQFCTAGYVDPGRKYTGVPYSLACVLVFICSSQHSLLGYVAV